MTTEKVIKGLKTIKTYCASTLLEELDCAILVLEKLDAAGVKEPLKADFSKLTEKELEGAK